MMNVNQQDWQPFWQQKLLALSYCYFTYLKVLQGWVVAVTIIATFSFISNLLLLFYTNVPRWNNSRCCDVNQVNVVGHWTEKGIANREPVGIYGCSYGRYMSAMCLAKCLEIFKVAVAGAMVSSWDCYDTCYTERYMRTPQLNPDGYARSAVMPYVEQIKGSILIVHGLIDENVHFRHSARLISALIKAQKHYELLLFPDERHVPRGLADKVFMEQRIASFFERCL